MQHMETMLIPVWGRTTSVVVCVSLSGWTRYIGWHLEIVKEVSQTLSEYIF